MNRIGTYSKRRLLGIGVVLSSLLVIGSILGLNVARSAAVVNTGSETISSPTSPYTVPVDSNGNPIDSEITVIGNGWGTGVVYAEICDGKNPSAAGWSPQADCDDLTETAGFAAGTQNTSPGEVIFTGGNSNYGIPVFRGVSPNDEFNCLAPGDDPDSTSVSVPNAADASQVAVNDPDVPSWGASTVGASGGGTAGCQIRLTYTPTTQDPTSDQYLTLVLPQQGASAPGAPTGVSASPNDGSATVSWSAPASDGGSAITGYTATATPGNETCTTTNALTCNINGLTNGTEYTITVTATNGAGTGPASSAVTVTPDSSVVTTVPGPPTDVTATAGSANATVSWLAPSSDGGSAISRYTVTSAPGGYTCSTTGALTCVVSGLANGTAYTFTVTATNFVGTGPASTPSNSVTPAAAVVLPGAPTDVLVTAGDGSAKVSWTAPATGGNPTGYTATSAPGSETCTTTSALSCTVSGLTNGDAYTFTVAATNSAGTGPSSAPSSAVVPEPPTVAVAPDAPIDVSAVAGNSQATVTWAYVPTVDDGGSPVTGYTATSSPGGLTCTTTGAVACTVSGLTNYVTYTFTVTASNAAGTSVASRPSTAVTPYATSVIPIVSPASADQGYLEVGADGGLFNFGSLPYKGSEGGTRLNSPIVGVASTPDGGGYWLVAADGGVFTFGDATFYGSEGGTRLNSPIVGVASTPDGGGYWLVAADGGVFTFGDADYDGSEGGKALSARIVGVSSPLAVPVRAADVQFTPGHLRA